YSTNQYLTRRCLTFSQQEFNFQTQKPVDTSGACTKFQNCPICQYSTESITDIIISPATAGSGDVSSNTLIYTIDGQNWIGLGNDIFKVRANVVKYNGNIWVAGGKHSSLQGVDHTLAYSYDGVKWTGNNGDPFSDEVIDIAYSNNIWVAVGINKSSTDYFLCSSSDGINW
ncbi:MAG: hypothetical protein V3W20_04890, partial [Candidatus Neomarinimicrobiota bacterium]